MAEQNNQQREIRDYFKPMINDNYSSIARQSVNANNFELNLALINMVQQNQFGGSPLEDPNVHLAIFLKIYDTVKMNGVTEDSIQLRLFPFSLRDKASGWLQALQRESITTGEEMAQKFLSKFFPLVKTTQLRAKINSRTLSHYMRPRRGLKTCCDNALSVVTKIGYRSSCSIMV